MKNLLILIIISFFILSSCSAVYIPQTIFMEGANPNKLRLEGNYSHESRLYSLNFGKYNPQTQAQFQSYNRKDDNEYIPQSFKSLELKPSNFDFIGSWNIFEKNKLVGTIKLNNNNTGLYLDEEGKEWNISWQYENNKIFIGAPLRYRYYYSPNEIDWEMVGKVNWIGDGKFDVRSNDTKLILQQIK